MYKFMKRLPLEFGEVPETLYHYTTQLGLLGIVGNEKIWMTHTQYLNDTQEFKHAIGLVDAEIKQRLDAAKDEVEERVLIEMLSSIHHDLSNMNVCVCCFSEEKDLLSQWRAYGDSMSGYSIGFCGAYLSNLAKRKNFQLVKCIYDSELQMKVVSEFVELILNEILENQGVQPDDDNYYHWHNGGNLVPYLVRLAPIFKDGSFSDEKEWRIISRALSCREDGYNYRIGKSMLIPYLELSIESPEELQNEKRYREIVVGPTPNQKQSQNAVISLLAKKGLANDMAPGGAVHVNPSIVPFRAW